MMTRMPSLVVRIFLAFFVAQQLVETALILVNLRHAKRTRGVPGPLSGLIEDRVADRSREYTLANNRLSLVQGLYGAGVAIAVLFSGVLPWLDRALAAAGVDGAHRFVAFLAITGAALSLVDLPFAAWRTFVLEARFGFNRTTVGLWALDRLKGMGIAAAIGIPFLYATYGFMRFSGPWWWLWLFAFVVTFEIVMLWVWPTVLAPLFNRFTPLPAGLLRERLEALASEAGFVNRGLYVMDASRRSGHSNAYFTGLFRPRIVLFDTLVERMTVDEAASVLAHEIGHYRRRHVHRRLALSLVTMLLTLFVLSRLVPWPPLYAAFGFEGPSLHAALALATIGGGAFVFWTSPLSSWLSRRHEYEADRYSVLLARAPAALKSALVRLGGENLSNLHPHPLFSAWHYSHPTLVERLAAIDRIEGRAAPADPGIATSGPASASRSGSPG
jgi:STE24 endopeptidase